MSPFVSVPVPEEHVPAVYALLHELTTNPNEAEDSSPRDRGWTAEELRSIHDCSLPSVQLTARVLDALAADPGTAMSGTELSGKLGVERAALQGAFSGFSRWVNRMWSSEDGWPITIEYGPSTTAGLTSESSYTVDTETAAQWRAVRKGDS